MRKVNAAISKNIITGLIVGLFVGTVIAALILVYIISPNQSENQQCSLQTQALGESQIVDNQKICVTSIQLYSGSSSSASYTENCTGDAQIVIEGQNILNRTFYLTNATVWGGSLAQNASAMDSLSNACIPISNSTPEIAPLSFFSFYEYIESALVPGSQYHYNVEFNNGQNLIGILIAQV